MEEPTKLPKFIGRGTDSLSRKIQWEFGWLQQELHKSMVRGAFRKSSDRKGNSIISSQVHARLASRGNTKEHGAKQLGPVFEIGQ